MKIANNHLHFVGIGGSGMSSLAEMSLHKKYRVSGSDLVLSPKLSLLTSLGAKINHQNESRLDDHCTVVVSTAIPPDHPDLIAAKQRGLQVVHRSDLLNYFMDNSEFSIAIGGTHGKTTTSALIAHMLNKTGNQPSAVIGGAFWDTKSSILGGANNLFVAEVDESDGTIEKYHPNLAILTNIDKDHLDRFRSLDELANVFKRYLNNIKPEGVSVLYWDQKISQELAETLTHEKITYGFRIGAEVRCLGYEPHGRSTKFSAMVDKTKVQCTIPLIGRHNILNGLCALSVAKALEIDLESAANALSSFPGVERRMSLLLDTKNVKVFDDYAHNPGKISACLSSLREWFPSSHIIAIFEPHRYSRLQTMFEELVSSFSTADCVLVAPIYSAGEKPVAMFTSEFIAKEIEKKSQIAAKGVTEHNILDILNQVSAQKPTICLTLGAGNLEPIQKRLCEFFDEKN
ncbi:MAG: UDP-N-acetylmuramate--L-alanine ligase [Oligoflexales bacterium]